MLFSTRLGLQSLLMELYQNNLRFTKKQDSTYYLHYSIPGL